MVGLIPKMLLDLVEKVAGPEAVAEVKRCAGVSSDKTFQLDVVYSDTDWQRLLASTCDVLKISSEQAEETYAEYFYLDAQKRWPRWFEMCVSSREFLERQPVIHNCLAAGLGNPQERQAVTDKFRVDKLEGEIIAHYRSPNRLCGLYKSLARCIIKHYGDKASIEESLCMKKGDPECEIHVRWEKNGSRS